MKIPLTIVAVALVSGAFADTERVGRYKWSYTKDFKNGGAIIENWDGNMMQCAVSPQPNSTLAIPAKLGGKPVKEIGEGCFRNCKNLTSVTIPKSVDKVSWYAFCGCDKLKKVVFEGDLPKDGYRVALYGAEGRYVVRSDVAIYANGKVCKDLPPSVVGWSGTEKIGGYTWSYVIEGDEAKICSRLLDKRGVLVWGRAVSPKPKGEIVIPSRLGGKSVTKIDTGAFSDCNGFIGVTIPKSIKQIDKHSHLFHNKLKRIVFEGGVPDVNLNTFVMQGNNLVVYVPKSLDESSVEESDDFSVPSESTSKSGPWDGVMNAFEKNEGACKFEYIPKGGLAPLEESAPKQPGKKSKNQR